MSAIKGKYRNGQIILAQKADWPENTDVLVAPVEAESKCGISEEEWTDSPEEIADWLRWYDSLEPLIMTPEEEKAWHEALQAQKEYDLSKLEERMSRIEKLFE
jgi:hypothetical protein